MNWLDIEVKTSKVKVTVRQNGLFWQRCAVYLATILCNFHVMNTAVLKRPCLYQVRQTFLDYINDLAMSLDSSELSNTDCVQQIVMRVVSWASEPRCARIRQVITTHDSLVMVA